MVSVTWQPALTTQSAPTTVRPVRVTIVALSAHPGLITQQEKDERRQIDEKWSQKLRELSFDEFLAEWYTQPIFQTFSQDPSLLQTIIKRRMKQDPQTLSRVLMQMSLSDQPHICKFSCPTLFLHGEKDLKYRQLYSTLPETVTVHSVKNSGHAPHIENAAECAALINSWIEVVHANS